MSARIVKASLFVAVLAAGCPPTDDGGGNGSGPPPSGAPRYVYEHQGPISSDPKELPVTVVKEFTCDPEEVGDRMVVAKTLGAPGEDVVIEPADAECHFNLRYRTGAERSLLSSAPGGYLLVAARRFPDGVRAVCASDIVHGAGADGVRSISQVAIRCWASATASFTATTVAITPDGEWAAWVRDLIPIQGRTGAFLLEWTRDMSFQFLNLSDEGRVGTDGVYRTELTYDGSALIVGATTKISARTNPFAGEPAKPWVPSPEELRELDGLIDLSGLDQP